MASELVADFVATVDAPPLGTPRRGRVMMRRDHIVCATEDHRIDVPLTAVRDVGVGAVPPEMRAYFDDSVTIAYDEGAVRNTVILESRAESMESFRTLLFKCLLTGKAVNIRYPANRGGHVLDTHYGPGRLAIERGDLLVRRPEDDVTLPLNRVTSFTYGRGRIDGDNRWLIAVGVLQDDTVVTARIVPDEQRMLPLLGRYLKLEYSHIRHEVAQLDLEEPAFQSLVALDAGTTELQETVPGVEEQDELLERLAAHDLIASNGDEYDLTRRGRIATKTHLESANN